MSAPAETTSLPKPGGARVLSWLKKLFSKPHMLGWIFNMGIVAAVFTLLATSYWRELHTNERVLQKTSVVASDIFSPSRSEYRSRTQQTMELSSQLVYIAWPLVIEGSDSQRADAILGEGPLADDYDRLDSIWENLRTQLESGVSSQFAVRVINETADRWVDQNTFYVGREPLFAIWLVLVFVYAVFVFVWIIPKSEGTGRTESLLLLVDVGLYFTIISWFTKTEIPDLGWIILAPVSIVFFELFKDASGGPAGRDRSVYLAALLFLFFLFFGVLQLRIEYEGAEFVINSVMSALRDFVIYVAVGAMIAGMLMLLFRFSSR